MSDTFLQLVEADIGSLLNTAGQAVGDKVAHAAKQVGNRALSTVSARATGRFDRGAVYKEVLDKWKYFLTTQRTIPTVASFVDFIQTVYGMALPEATVYTAVYGFDPTKSPKPPKMISPNKAVVDSRMKVIMGANSTQPKILAASQDLVRYANANEADENYIVMMLKWMGAKNPELLNRDGMEPLSAFKHGGKLTREQTTKLLRGLASLIIKRQLSMQAMKQQGPDGKPAATTGDPATDKQNKGKVASTASKISFDPPALQQQPNWGGINPPTDRSVPATIADVQRNIRSIGFNNMKSFEDYAARAEQDDWWEAYRNGVMALPASRINALSAQLMSVVARLRIQQMDFVSALTQIQQQNNVMVWPRQNLTAAYRFMRMGGAFDEVTAELNHFCNNQQKASLIFIALLRFIAKAEARNTGIEDGD